MGCRYINWKRIPGREQVFNNSEVTVYLVKGTSSRWSMETEVDLLSTEGVKVRKESVLVVAEQVKSDPEGLCDSPLDWPLWQARQEQGLPPALLSPWLGAG